MIQLTQLLPIYSVIQVFASSGQIIKNCRSNFSIYTSCSSQVYPVTRGGQKRHKTGGKALAMHKRKTVFPTRFIQLCCFGNKGYRGLLLKVFPNSTGRLSSRVHHVPQISCWNMATLTFDLNDVAIGMGHFQWQSVVMRRILFLGLLQVFCQ